jgi:hypothetical protein
LRFGALETNSRIQVMAHGGPRNGAGRKPGTATKLNEAARKQAAEGGLMPLDYMLSLLRDEELDRDARMDAAKAAAPYVHARLAAVEHSTDPDKPLGITFTWQKPSG